MSREIPNVPIQYNEQLAREAAEIAKRLSAPSGDKIKTDNNRAFITPDGLEGSTLQVVIVDFISSNAFYDSIYDSNNPSPPACFALGPEPSLLIPSSNSPNRQADTCATCPNNQFGTSNSGRGKACKNTRLLAVSPAGEWDDGERPLWVLSVPPAAIKNFDSYAKHLATRLHTVPIGVVTEISLDQRVTYAAPQFKAVRALEGEELNQFLELRHAAIQRLTAEPDVSKYTPPARPPRGRTVSR